MGECLVFTGQKWTGRREMEKADRTRSGGGCCSRNSYQQQPKPLDVSASAINTFAPCATRRCTSNCLIMIRPIVPSIVAYGHVHQEQSFCAKLS